MKTISLTQPFLIFLFSIILYSCSHSTDVKENKQKVKTIITTDGEIDDIDTFIRLLLYANEFEIEGLIYSSSMWHYKGDGKGTLFTSEMEMTKALYGERTDLRWPGTLWIEELITAYNAVYPNLILHDTGYPSPEKLKKMIRVGNIDFEGEMEKITPGSEWIKEKLLAPDSDDLFLQAWGGTNTIARALKSIEEEYKNTDQWETVYQRVSEKAIIYTIMDQDATYKKYIGIQWPDIRVFYNSFQFAGFAYSWQRIVPKALQPYLEGEFMKNSIQNHGPLLDHYYSYGDGKKQKGDEEHIHGDLSKIKDAQWGSFDQYAFISEGDTPAFLHLVDVGLANYNHPSFGGWGGRFVASKTTPSRFEDGEKAADINTFTGKLDSFFPQTRWTEVIQNDFAARADWCVKSYAEANHPPEIGIKQKTQLQINAGDQKRIEFNSSDPDGDSIQHKAWVYEEMSTSKASQIVLSNEAVELTISPDAKSGEVLHLIIEGKDSGTPPLTRYQRILFTIN